MGSMNGGQSAQNTNPKQARTEANQAAFLAALKETGNITAAAKAASIARRSHYEWLADPDYAGRYREAMDVAIDALEQEARRRAVDGSPEPVFFQGKPVGAIRKYSDTLLIFLLKGHRPEKYRDRYEIKHAGKVSVEHGDPFGLLNEPEVTDALDRAVSRRAKGIALAEPGRNGS